MHDAQEPEPERAGARAGTGVPPQGGDARAVLDVAPTGLAVVDRDLRITLANPALTALTAAGAPAPVGRLLTDVLPAATQVEQVCRQVLADGQPVTGWEVTAGPRLRPGAPIRRRIDVHPLGTPGGGGGALAVVVADVTEHHRALGHAAALEVLTEELSGAGSLDEVLRVAIGRAGAAVGAAAASIGLLEPGGGWFRMITVGFPDRVARAFDRLPVDVPLPGPASVRDGQARYYPDRGASEAEFPDARAVLEGTAYQAAAVQPLLVEGAPLGYLAVHFPERGELPSADRHLLAAVARACAAAVERARRGDRERAERDVARRLESFAAALAAASTADDVAAILTRQAPGLLGATLAIVGLYHPETRTFSLTQPTSNTPVDLVARFARWPLDAPLPSRDVFHTGRPVLLRSLAERDRCYPALAGVEVAEQAWAQLPLRVRGRTLGTLAFGWPGPRDFPPEQVRLMQAIADVCSGALERARLADEQRHIAESLQRSLLPLRLPDLPGWHLAARYQPAGAATRAGGDWYDAFPLSGGRVGLLIGDVAGHGITAAGLMGQVRALSRALARDGAAPGEVLTALNAAVCDLDDGRDATFATCCYVQLDPQRRQLRAASAGHLPPLVRLPRTAEGSDAGSTAAPEVEVGPPLGVRPASRYPTTEAPLPAGATVLLFTDGLVERHDRLLDDGLAELTRRMARAPAPVEALCAALMAAVLDDTVPTDDIALLAATDR